MDIPGTAPTTAAASAAAIEAASLTAGATPAAEKETRKKRNGMAKPGQEEPVVKRGGRQAGPVHSGLSGKRVDIILHDSDRIPPGGQFIGINGLSFMLLPGVRANVPVELLSVLDDAVMTEPVLNDRLQVDGHRDVPRLTYTLLRD